MKYILKQLEQKLNIAGDDHLPCGKVIGAVDVTDCYFMIDDDFINTPMTEKYQSPRKNGIGMRIDHYRDLSLQEKIDKLNKSKCKVKHVKDIEFSEYHYGDFTGGRYAWKLENSRTVDNPITINGSMGMWDLDREMEKQKNIKSYSIFINGKDLNV